MIEITDYKSASGSQRHIHRIYADTPYAQFLQLKEEYKLQDEDFIKANWKTQVDFNTAFLKLMRSKLHGNLICVYCGKENLKVSHWSTKKNKNDLKMLATADHFWAKSIGGGAYDVTNLVPACHRCNQKKRSAIMSLDMLVYVNRYPNYEEIIEGLKKIGQSLGHIEK